MTESDSTELPLLNEETLPLDAAVVVGWWFEFGEDGRLELDTFHSFHDAGKTADGGLPETEDSEVTTTTGAPVDPNGALEGDARDPRHVFLTHRETLLRGIDPRTNCPPWYATDRHIEREQGDNGLLTEPGVRDVVFKLSTRYDLGSGLIVDSLYDSHISMLYHAHVIRRHVGSTGRRLRASCMPIRRCDYMSFEQAMAAGPSITHMSKLRSIQPDELPATRDRFGGDALRTQVVHEYRVMDMTDTRPSAPHESESPPYGYGRDSPF